LSKKKFDQKKKLDNLFDSLQIFKGDNLVIHSNFAGILQYQNNNLKVTYEYFFLYLINRIGKNGSLLIPTYNYSFSNGAVYDRSKSPSQVGSFGNYLIKKKYLNRTFDPIFSHLVFGKLKKKIFKLSPIESLGKKSIFNLIDKEKFKILCFCCSLKNVTFIHYIEMLAQVPYRFNKFFTGNIKNKSSINKITIKYFVGKKNTDYSLKEKKILKLLPGKNLIEKLYGRFNCYVINSNTFKKKLLKKLKKNSMFLIK